MGEQAHINTNTQPMKRGGDNNHMHMHMHMHIHMTIEENGEGGGTPRRCSKRRDSLLATLRCCRDLDEPVRLPFEPADMEPDLVSFNSVQR